jgi:hypothetical protein
MVAVCWNCERARAADLLLSARRRSWPPSRSAFAPGANGDTGSGPLRSSSDRRSALALYRAAKRSSAGLAPGALGLAASLSKSLHIASRNPWRKFDRGGCGEQDQRPRSAALGQGVELGMTTIGLAHQSTSLTGGRSFRPARGVRGSTKRGPEWSCGNTIPGLVTAAAFTGERRLAAVEKSGPGIDYPAAPVNPPNGELVQRRG